MNKSQELNSFYNSYKYLKETEREQFSRLANKMLSSCLLTLKKEKDRNDFFLIIGRLPLYKSYFSLMNYELNYYEKDQVLHLVNTENNHLLHLKKLESIALLTIRKLYFLKMQEIALNDEITITIEDFHDELLKTGLFQRRINKTELNDCFRIMKRFSLVEAVGDIEKDQTVVKLFPTILYIIPYNKIEEIDEILKNYEKGGADDEGIKEDTID